MKNVERVSVKEAAEELKLNQEMLRYMMQADKLPIGYAIKKPNSQRWAYVIYRGLLEQYKKGLAS